MVGHPHTWVAHQAPGFIHEGHHPPMMANPTYIPMAVPAFR
jgi:hypothetical protein